MNKRISSIMLAVKVGDIPANDFTSASMLMKTSCPVDNFLCYGDTGDFNDNDNDRCRQCWLQKVNSPIEVTRIKQLKKIVEKLAGGE